MEGMPARRRVDPAAGAAALARAMAAADVVGAAGAGGRADLATASRYLLDELSLRAPGRSVEVRVPPYGVVQCVGGPRHTRGTPPNVVETDPETWLQIATGALDWHAAVASGQVAASGDRSDLSAYLPLVG